MNVAVPYGAGDAGVKRGPGGACVGGAAKASGEAKEADKEEGPSAKRAKVGEGQRRGRPVGAKKVSRKLDDATNSNCVASWDSMCAFSGVANGRHTSIDGSADTGVATGRDSAADK